MNRRHGKPRFQEKCFLESLITLWSARENHSAATHAREIAIPQTAEGFMKRHPK